MSDRVEFKPPKGVVPEDVSSGDTFDLVTTYRLKPSGEICVIQIGDQKMPGYDEDQYEQEGKNKNRQSYADVMGSMQSVMSEGGQGGAGGGGGY